MRSYSHRHICSALLVLCAGSLLLLSQRLALESLLGRLSHRAISQWNAQSGTSGYRQLLSTVRPLDTAPHSKTLGIADRIYVVNLPARTDRRETMSDLERAMDLEFTWHDATDFHTKDIQDILERVRWWRNENRVNDSVPKADPSPFKFSWADDIDDAGPNLGTSGSDLWPESVGKSLLPPLPEVPTPDDRPRTLETFGEAGSHFGRDAIRPAQISCWYSHYRVLRRIAEGEDEVAIVFEDDIDMEWDLELRLRRMWTGMPADWDVVMIGHCHDKVWKLPSLEGAPFLYPTQHTLCTHAYAVHRRAARRIVRLLRSEAFSYSRPIDHALFHLAGSHRINTYSVFPPPVIQTYESKSDIAPWKGKERVQWLQDSVRERIALAKGNN